MRVVAVDNVFGKSKTGSLVSSLLGKRLWFEMQCSIGPFKYVVNFQNIAKQAKSVKVFLEWETRNLSKSNYKFVTTKPIRNPVKIMKLDSPQFKACITEEVKYLNHLFTTNGYEIRIVGGAVRDLLMGIQPEDLDFSTTATPVEMKKMFMQNEIRLINENGEKHGTLTSRINNKNFEVTTLRIDLATNGRHAEVEFTKDWVLDANRRDLTINAMYLALDGTVYDYFNGCEDLKNKRVVFVGDAATRIEEDYLRILRYFRFYGRISDLPDNHDKDILKAIKENAEGLQGISGERIWVELNKILSGKFVEDIVLKMISVGLGPYIGFPKEPNEAEFRRVMTQLKMKDETAKPITLLAGLFNNENELNDFYLRIKPSKSERDLGYFILNNRGKKTDADQLKRYKSLLVNFSRNTYLVWELMKYEGNCELIEELRQWQVPVFPIKGTMLKNLGINGREVGEVLNHLKDVWHSHNFEISAEKLLEYAPKKKKKIN